MLRRTSVWSLYFNSLPHKEADGMWKRAEGAIYISTHSLTRRLTARIWQKQKQNQHFNSQPHKEADYVVYIIKYIYNISTHSLTRRLTRTTDYRIIQEVYISTHSLTRRLTLLAVAIHLHDLHFNSQPHKEADYN